MHTSFINTYMNVLWIIFDCLWIVTFCTLLMVVFYMNSEYVFLWAFFFSSKSLFAPVDSATQLDLG